jgi:hypothetical protein
MRTFAFLRTQVAPAHAADFCKLVEGVGASAPTAWGTIEAAGGPATFDARLQTLLSRPKADWASLINAFGSVAGAIPEGLDRDRAGLALVPVAALPSGTSLMTHLIARCKKSDDPDRIATLEWMARVMAGAGRPDRFDKAIHLIESPSASSTPEERRRILAELAEAAGPKGFDAALAIVESALALSPDDFKVVGPLAVELVRAMHTDVPAAREALSRLLSGRASGLYGQAPLDVLVTRFGELYTAGGSVDRAIARLEQEARNGDLHIEQGDDYVVIGGIKVPKTR